MVRPHLVELRVTTGGSGIADQCPLAFPGQRSLKRKRVVRIQGRHQQDLLLGQYIPRLRLIQPDDLDGGVAMFGPDGILVLQPKTVSLGKNLSLILLPVHLLDDRA